MLKVDLHTHTLASDGALTPAALVERAARQGVECLAVTDHDTCAGLAEARAAAESHDLKLIDGIELSTQWQGIGIHVVGLNIDPASPAMTEAVAQQSEARRRRAAEIDRRLSRKKMPGVYSKAAEIAGESQLGRPHFARAMVALGFVASEQEAFDRFLGAGKIGDVKCHWPEVAQAVAWIRAAGGVAVLAHPGKYQMTWSKLRRFLEDFVEVGGEAIEVSYGGENPDRLRELTRMAAQYGLKASVGSDFHSPRYQWTEIGKYPPVRGDYRPVWTGWL